MTPVDPSLPSPLRRTNDDAPIALVTGANRGIGFGVVRALAERGFRVILGARDLGRGEEAVHRLGELASAVSVCALDVADDGSVAAMARWVGERYDRLDVLVNNAAIDYDSDQSAVTADLGRARTDLDTNLFGAWRTTQALLPLLRRSAHGRIVNVSSEAGSIAGMTGGLPAYSISKAALNALTRLLAGELRADRILVNAVCPGWTNTEMGGGGRPLAEGAASVVWAATLPDDGPTGGFFRDGAPLAW
ncbi:SDR family oxidoreductase [Leifsonia sp. AG29]|uniref:SDR family oxidoreductase n=1 Tax=Leifsonia sp. AG29 TaxID=2598860 RepID=UPI00131AAFCA|nr:SDR family oxidoreductase [Leifsonia sp. AG29]